MGLVTLQSWSCVLLLLLGWIWKSMSVIMPIRTALHLNHGVGCHVLFVVAMVRIRGQSFAIHLYRLIHLRCSVCHPPLFLFKETITRNIKMLLFFLTMFSVLADVLPFPSSKINKDKTTLYGHTEA